MMMTKQRRIVKTFTLDPWHIEALATTINKSALVRVALDLFITTDGDSALHRAYSATFTKMHTIDETPPADMAQSGASQIDISASANNTTTVVVGESETSYLDDTQIRAGGDNGR